MSEIKVISGFEVTEEMLRTASEVYVDAWKPKLMEEYRTDSDKEIYEMAFFQFQKRVEAYPKGQLFATYEGRFIGSINTLKIKPDTERLSKGWEKVTGKLIKENNAYKYEYPHDPEGNYILCIAIQSDKKSGVKGTARKIIESVKEEKGILTYSTLMGYKGQYMEDFVIKHPVVTFHEHLGAKKGAVLPNARGKDPIIIMKYKDPENLIPSFEEWSEFYSSLFSRPKDEVPPISSQEIFI